MALSRSRAKGRKEGGSFLAMPHDVLHHKNFSTLSAYAVKLLLDLGAQFRGSNNGDLCAAWTLMRERGWRSKTTLYRALRELETKGFIVRTRQGGLGKASLYAITWKPIDDCGGKLDMPSTRIAPGYWKQGFNPEMESQSHICTGAVQ